MKELSQACGMSLARTRVHVKRLEEAGLIVHRKDSKYQSVVVLVPVRASEAARANVQSSGGAPRVEPETKPETLYEAKPERSTKASEKAKRISGRFNIPAYMHEYGEVSVGKQTKCSRCSNGTPLKYGTRPFCAPCARK
jgi:DNA-binding MarR family transcriptional regulator